MDDVKNQALTIRGLVIGLVGSVVITASSMYVALRMGALPWPTIFVAVVSLTALRWAKNSTLQEINVTHTAMSAGAMVAGGLAFTIPGIWILDSDASVGIWPILSVTLFGTLLGVLFTHLHRKHYIETKPLPYPMGTAAFNTLTVGDAGGKQAVKLFGSMGISAVFTALRDRFMIIPPVFMTRMPGANTPPFGMWLSPMAVGIGYIVGPLYTGVWFLGAVVGFYLIIPFGIALGFFPDGGAADLFRQNLGIGLMVGTGAGIFIMGLYRYVRKSWENRSRSSFVPRLRAPFWIASAIVIILAITTSLTLLHAILLILGIWITTSMAALLTGETGINPMEIFGIIVLLGIQIIQRPDVITSFMIAGMVAVACGLTGDVMNDLKAGHMLGTPSKSQIIAETAGGVLGAVVAVAVLFIMKEAFGTFGTQELPAPQAAAVSAMVGGLADPLAFFIGLALGIFLYLVKVPATTLGLGVYLPIVISSIVFLGGLFRFISDIVVPGVKKEAFQRDGGIVASGFLGGEGITGVILAIVSIFS